MSPEEGPRDQARRGGNLMDTGPLTVAPIVAGGAKRALRRYRAWMDIARDSNSESVFFVDVWARKVIHTEAGQAALRAFLRSADELEAAGDLDTVQEASELTSWTDEDVDFLSEVTDDLGSTVDELERALKLIPID